MPVLTNSKPHFSITRRDCALVTKWLQVKHLTPNKRAASSIAACAASGIRPLPQYSLART